MSCPFASNSSEEGHKSAVGSHKGQKQVNYSEYLQLDKLLNCQKPQSQDQTRKTAPDELLFIVTHQAYELWFKEVIYEIDSIRNIFLSSESGLNEEKTLHIISLLKRIVAIFKLLKDQFQCLETMTPFGFMEFRDFLSPASGFQSAQFRLLENKLGVSRGTARKALAEQNDAIDITDAIKEGKEREEVQASSECLSLQQIVQLWLSRTPGLEEDGFNFWGKLQAGVNTWFSTRKAEAEAQTDEDVKAEMLKSLKTTTETFESVFYEERYNQSVTRGERRFSHKAFQGALMIYYYRDQPRFHEPFQILQLLIDIDNLIIKWRYNHVQLVQRIIGTKTGTGGTSGYQYLRSTISDRYKVFIDLLHLSNFLVPLEYIPRLTRGMKTVLRQVNKSYSESDSATWTDTSDED